MRIIWSKRARYDFYSIQNYLEQFWPPMISKKFVEDTLSIINLLENNPMLGKYNPNLKCRSIVVSKYVTLYYETKENYTELISFYNNRQKPISIINL